MVQSKESVQNCRSKCSKHDCSDKNRAFAVSKSSLVSGEIGKVDLHKTVGDGERGHADAQEQLMLPSPARGAGILESDIGPFPISRASGHYETSHQCAETIADVDAKIICGRKPNSRGLAGIDEADGKARGNASDVRKVSGIRQRGNSINATANK